MEEGGGADQQQEVAKKKITSFGELNFFDILTESKRNEIKRMIGNAFMTILMQITIKIILRKQSYQRSEWEINTLVKLLKRQRIFKKFPKMADDDDFRELTKYLSYKEVRADENKFVIEENDLVENYFIILRGRVKGHQRNPKLAQWEWA